jgi:hypothetical protein
MAHKLAAVLLLCVLLSSCTGALPGGMEDLLVAPTLNAQQAEVSLALEATINLSDMVYRYPTQDSAYRTPIIFYDLDGNGVEEAIVFYSLTVRPSEIRFKVLRRDGEGKWYAFRDYPGQGDQIESVQFAYLTDKDRPSIIMGWYNSSRQNRQLEIYSMRGDDVERESRMGYFAYSVVAYPGDLSRLLVVAQESRGDPLELQLLGSREGLLLKRASVWLYEEVVSILQMKQGLLWNGDKAIYLDEVMDVDTVATEIIRFGKDSLELVAGGTIADEDSPQMTLYRDTYRPTRLLSVDIDGDGILEVPDEAVLPGIEESDEYAPIRKTVYYKLGEQGFALVRSAVVNQEAGYLIFLPDRWLETVTVVDNAATDQRSFHMLDPKTLLPSTELLRVTVRSSRDYADAPRGYFLLEERGAMRYYGYLPEASGNPLELTEEELRSIFALT